MNLHLQKLSATHPHSWRRRTAIALIISLNCCLSFTAIVADEKVQQAPYSDAENVSSQRQAIVESFRHDAALADVHFVDRAKGWAVGDRGVIWHSEDGGTTWRQQSSGVTCRLNSVYFINSQRGWAVGGEDRPYTDSTRGVVLHTNDAGNTWTTIPQTALPRLTHVKFFDNDRGVAFGDVTATHPSGVFFTQDGGSTWQSLSSDRAGGWLAGDFLDMESGAVAGISGQFATMARRQIIHSPLATPSLHSFHAMRLMPPASGWLVGDGGLVLTTKDLGNSWQAPSTELPEYVTKHFDFYALDVVENCVWVAGSPGTRVFHSSDNGQTWQASATSQSVPLRALCFVDAEHGWAVGEFGNIVATQDGGRSWKSQRSGAQRAALLAVFANATDVPLELFADAGAAEGYVAAAEIMHSTSMDPSNARAREAMLLAGSAAAETAWRFPLPPSDLAHNPADLLAELNRATDGRATEQIDEHLVRAIRLWRPDVLVTHHKKMETSEPRAALLAALILQAVQAAADPSRHPELAADVGLAPWHVKKVYGVMPPELHGTESIATSRFSPWLGTSLADFVAPARHLLLEERASPQNAYELELLTSQISDTNGPRGLFKGVSLAPGSEARRPQPDLPVNDLADLRRLATRRRNLDELLQRTSGNLAWAAQITNLTDGLSANDGGDLLAQLADAYCDAGRLDAAADTYYLLSHRYPDHPLTDRALVWLVQFYASVEAAHVLESRAPVNIREAPLEQSVQLEPQNVSRAEVQQASATAPSIDASPAIGLSRDDRLRRAVQLANYLQAARPAVYAEPSVRFAEVVAQRRLGFTNPAKRYYLSLRKLPETDPWRRCAETEEWLAKPADLPPSKTLAACRPAQQQPHLDGNLDEPFWESADRLRLRHDTDESTKTSAGEVRLTYDKEYLYVAVRCEKIAALDYHNNDAPRSHDADVSQYDRLTLHIDVDRDFTTAFEFSVDSRGWTNDECWHDAKWNPDWFVAAASDETHWTIEAAMPLSELVAEPPAARHVWAVAVRRTIPRIGYQSWAGDAASESPDQFGFLIFE